MSLIEAYFRSTRWIPLMAASSFNPRRLYDATPALRPRKRSREAGRSSSADGAFCADDSGDDAPRTAAPPATARTFSMSRRDEVLSCMGFLCQDWACVCDGATAA